MTTWARRRTAATGAAKAGERPRRPPSGGARRRRDAMPSSNIRRPAVEVVFDRRLDRDLRQRLDVGVVACHRADRAAASRAPTRNGPASSACAAPVTKPEHRVERGEPVSIRQAGSAQRGDKRVGGGETGRRGHPAGQHKRNRRGVGAHALPHRAGDGVRVVLPVVGRLGQRAPRRRSRPRRVPPAPPCRRRSCRASSARCPMLRPATACSARRVPTRRRCAAPRRRFHRW